jgi:hypothetical protein
MQESTRAAGLAEALGRPDLTDVISRLSDTAGTGLAGMLLPDTVRYPQTARLAPDGRSLSPEGRNTRYAAMVALGLGRLSEKSRAHILGNHELGELVERAVLDALHGQDPGAMALAAWAAAETGIGGHEPLLHRLADQIRSASPLPTVDFAWALTALVADPGAEDGTTLAEQAAHRLLAAQGEGGLFPHVLPPQTQSRLRAHIGCFADQVYPIQALARFAAATGNDRALEASAACARRIVDLQGESGQWWWHYDARVGDLVEGYPVYSVHQHAMGPMALFDLTEAGGPDFGPAIVRGLDWIRHRPETEAALVDESLGVIWRKVGRRERRKAVRTVRAVTTAVRPGLRLDWLDAAFPPGPVDHECRPYELGWLLYAWHSPIGSPAPMRGVS